MAVSKVIEARAYFHEQDTESPESPRPCKRQRLQTPVLEDNLPESLAQQEQGYTPPLDITSHPPSPSSTQVPAPPCRNPVISKAAHEALSAPWAGPTDFHHGDDDTFEDSSDIGGETAQPVSIPGPTEPSGSDTESDVDVDSDNADGNNIGPSEAEMGEVPDIFETNADLDAAEYSECTVVSVC